MYVESEFIQLSALQHYVFCPRQCALIHIEKQWTENYLTAKGRVLHEKVHQADTESRQGVITARGLRIVSFALGIVGQADVVEFYNSQSGTGLSGTKGLWKPFPVEYKKGKAKKDDCDNVQLCAQAMCLEEMLKTQIPQGALYYGKVKKRTEVNFDFKLRQKVKETSLAVHKLFKEKITPKAKYVSKCKSCSLMAQCLPKATGIDKKIDSYLSKAGTDEGLIE